MTPDNILALIGIVLVLTACGLNCVTFLKTDEDLLTIRKRQTAIAVLFLAAAAVTLATGTYYGFAAGTLWFLFACSAAQTIPTKKKAAKQRAKREGKLAAARAAELERSNAEADELARKLQLPTTPRMPEQRPTDRKAHRD